MDALSEAKRMAVIANRIVAREEVCDAFGHVSIRDPGNQERYWLARSLSPSLVTEDDLMEYTLDNEPVDQRDRRMYAERPIHGALYETRADVMAVIHNHSHAVIPFGVTDTPIRPLLHVASGIGPEVPIWDIRDNFGDTNMLVTTRDQGLDLAKTVGDKRCALMRGHGCVVCGPTLKEAVIVAVYLQVNANLQTTAMQMGEIRFLSEEEERLFAEIGFSPLALDRAWEYFCARAGMAEG
jgi:HCOMODA/2-hydroxy-3-carboxy-muconic semialdehyde decarboxylase